MKGLVLARAYYEQCGIPMIEQYFSPIKDRLACGLAGEGSECFGFDDELSQDHDFGAAFCIWMTDEDYANYGDALSDAYANLPKEFMGYAARPPICHGQQRVGVMRISDFFLKFTGLQHPPETLSQWRAIPEPFLATATNGEVFYDPLGEFSQFRSTLLGHYPSDLRIKKIVARAAAMAQSGQYNYERCIRRGETVAAQFALTEFMQATCSMVYLLDKKYMPFYKWAHRGLTTLSLLSPVHGLLSSLCSKEKYLDDTIDIIEQLSMLVIEELKKQNLTTKDDDFLLDHCEEIMQHIKDPTLREMHIMSE